MTFGKSETKNVKKRTKEPGRRNHREQIQPRKKKIVTLLFSKEQASKGSFLWDHDKVVFI
jgi:hypothetical protein